MTTTKEMPKKEDTEIVSTDFMTPVSGKRERSTKKIRIPTFKEVPKVKGIFKNIELPGTGISFTFRAWKGAPVKFSLFDGCQYVIPKVVADHLNDNCHYKKFQWISSSGVISDGKPIVGGGRGFQEIGKDFSKELCSKKSRFMFQILEAA